MIAQSIVRDALRAKPKKSAIEGSNAV